MLKFASAAALCIVVVLSLSLSQSVEAKHPRRTVEHFEAFLTEHKRSYAGAEYFTRLDIFAENLRLIEESNADASTEFTLEINAFADETWEEFQSKYLMAQDPQAKCSATGSGPLKEQLKHEHEPKSQDWREKGIVSPVKNQGHCGSCWTFSTTGALEASYALEFGSILSLSEQQLVDCAQGFDNAGCSGGLPSHAFEYVRYNGGLDLEVAYPYKGEDGKHCLYKPDAAAVFVKDVVNITEGDEKMLKAAVGVVKPVSVAFQVVSDFRFYKNGTYTSKECKKGPDTVNHAVLAVGYHHDHYWIIKNSWGPEWGMGGYFQMGPIGENMCGVATCSSYPVLENPKTDRLSVFSKQRDDTTTGFKTA
jgi:cathepsin H